MEKFDVVVLGAGPAGYSAAVRLAESGLKVVCVCGGEPGGTCLNCGCIPTKSLLKSAGRAALSPFPGNESAKLSFGDAVARAESAKLKLRAGVEFMLKKAGVLLVRGFGRIISKNIVEVSSESGVAEIWAEKILLAVGCAPKIPSSVACDGEIIVSASGALKFSSPPESAVVVGAGAIGCEFAQIWSSFGSKVVLVEFENRILPREDAECADVLRRRLRRSGIKIMVSTKVLSASVGPSGAVECIVDSEGRQERLKAERLLVCAGVRPDLEAVLSPGFSLDTTPQGFVSVDKNYRTSVGNIYAAGDVIGPPALAHAAEREGILAAESIMRGTCEEFGQCCSCVYTTPEIASVGMSESEARALFGDAVRVLKKPFAALGRAVADGCTEGFAKILYNASDGRVLGAHIAGERAGDIISVCALALKKKATVSDLRSVVFPHPSYSEILR